MCIRLGNLISTTLEFKDIKQKRAAQDLGIPYSTFNNYVCNTREPDFETLIRIFTYLDLNLNTIFIQKKTSNPFTITKDEAHLLRLYRGMPNAKKKKMIAVNENISHLFEE